MLRLLTSYLKLASVLFIAGVVFYGIQHVLAINTDVTKFTEKLWFSQNIDNVSRFVIPPPDNFSQPHEQLFPMRNSSEIDSQLSGLRKDILGKPLIALEKLRATAIGLDLRKDWLYPEKKNQLTRSILGDHPEWLSQLENLTNTIGAVYVQAPVEQLSLYMDTHLYNWTSAHCEVMEKKSIMPAAFMLKNYHTFCFKHPIQSWQPQTLTAANMQRGLPNNYQHPNNQVTLTYIHVLREATVSQDGDVFVGHTKIVGHRCPLRYSREKESPKFPTINKQTDSVVYDEVFTLTQYWGEAYFHLLAEILPRLPPFITFLHNNPSIMIHIYGIHRPYVTAIYEQFGLTQDRFVYGMIRARVLYLPQSGPCGGSPVFNTRLQSMIQRSLIQTAPEQRRAIILIQRSKKRFFIQHQGILQALQALCEELGGVYHVEVFSDNPLPSMLETMTMFNSAFMVVAPHGAGESNLLYSEPGTILIEGLCKPPNLCYRNLAAGLGHRYHGIFKQDKDCFTLSPEDILEPVKAFMEIINN